MRLGVIPETLLERIALALGLVPEPLVDTQLMYSMARTIMAAAAHGIFEALADGPADAADVARRCGTDPRATEQLLNALAGVRYVRFDGRRYTLRGRYKRWLDPASDRSIREKLLMQLRFEWRFMEHYERYLKTGVPLEMHDELEGDDWAVYQRGMAALARVSASEVSRTFPMPRGARDVLDIGGAHGEYAAEVCRRHPGVRVTILDLPEAVARAQDMLEGHRLGERLRVVAGDVRTTELDAGAYDAVFSSQLAHHFDAHENRALAGRVARALRPGGVYVVQDLVRPEGRADVRRMGAGALLDFYFGVTSAAGTWTTSEIASWQRDAGLEPRPPVWLRTLPGAVQQAAERPA